MSSREVVRTLKLSRPIHEAGEEIVELEFSEPDGRLLRSIERANAQNAAGKSFQSPTFLMLEHMTGVGEAALVSMRFGDVQRAAEIAAELSGVEVDEETEPGKS